MWKSETNSGEQTLYCVDSSDQTQIMRLGSKCLYLPSHLTWPDVLKVLLLLVFGKCEKSESEMTDLVQGHLNSTC